MSVFYTVNCRPLQDADELKRVLHMLHDDRRQKTIRLLQPQKRAQSAAVGLLTNYLLRGHAVAYNEFGQPIVPNDPDTHISPSHTGDWVFCAISDSPIGIDAQVVSPRSQGVVERLFSPMERTATSDDDFTRIWTYKEAYYKQLGNAPMSTIAITDFSRSPHYDTFTDCFYWHDYFRQSIHVTACVKKEQALPSEIIELSIADIS